jgi:transposase-like protein
MSKEKRRPHAPEQKLAILREHLVEHKQVSDACEHHKIAPSLFYYGQRQRKPLGKRVVASLTALTHVLACDGITQRQVAQPSRSGPSSRPNAHGVQSRTRCLALTPRAIASQPEEASSSIHSGTAVKSLCSVRSQPASFRCVHTRRAKRVQSPL